MAEKEKLSELAHKLEACAAAGLGYTHNKFDIEHYEDILKLSRQLLSEAVDIPAEDAEKLLEGHSGYETPKVETRAMIFDDEDRILLVKDHDGKWNPPGGWCEFNLSVKENTIKEALEETGLKVEPYRLAAVFDHRKNNNPDSFFSSCKFFVLCKSLGGSFVPNIETSESGYYALTDLPELNTHKCSRAQLELCLKAHRAEVWETFFD